MCIGWWDELGTLLYTYYDCIRGACGARPLPYQKSGPSPPIPILFLHLCFYPFAGRHKGFNSSETSTRCKLNTFIHCWINDLWILNKLTHEKSLCSGWVVQGWLQRGMHMGGFIPPHKHENFRFLHSRFEWRVSFRTRENYVPLTISRHTSPTNIFWSHSWGFTFV